MHTTSSKARPKAIDKGQMLEIPANTKHLYNICTTSAQSLRRWSNNVKMLYKYLVFARTVLVIIYHTNYLLYRNNLLIITLLKPQSKCVRSGSGSLSSETTLRK